MGCTVSKYKKIESKKVDCSFSSTYTLKLDQFFDDVKECLTLIEKVRHGIEDTRDNLLKDTCSICLKSPDLKEALRIMFWCISANNQGKIQNTKPNLILSPPYISMDISEDNTKEVKTLWKYLMTYMNMIKDGPQIISQETSRYNDYLDQFLENGLTELLAVHETSSQRGQAALNIAQNITKMHEQAIVLKRIKELVDDAKKEADKITDFIAYLIKTADEVGERAYRQGWLTPEEICLHCHPQLSRGAETIKSYKSKSKKARIYNYSE